MMITPLKGLRSFPKLPKKYPINDSLVSFVLVMLNTELCPHMWSNHSFGSLRSLFFLPLPLQGICRFYINSSTLHHNFVFLANFLDDEKCCRNCVDPGTKGAKTANIVSTGPEWAWLEKWYIHSDWTSDTDLWMTGGKGVDISARKRILIFFNFWLC